MDQFLVNFYNFFSKIQLHTKHIWLYSILISLSSILLVSPPLQLNKVSADWGNKNPGSANIVQRQIEKPLLVLNDFNGTQAGKRQFRLTMPVIGWLCHLNCRDLIILQIIIGFLFVYSIIYLVHDVFKFPLLLSLIIALIFSRTYVISGCFTDFWPFFDGIAYFLIFLCFFIRKESLIFLLIILISFIDERALISTVFIYAGKYFDYSEVDNSRSFWSFIKSEISLVIISAWIVYFSTRLILSSFWGFHTNTGGVFNGELLAINSTWKYFTLSLATTLKGLIIPILLILLYFYKKNKFLFIIILSGVSILIICSLFVFDTTKTITYIFPVFIIFLKIISAYPSNWSLKLLTIILLINILIPSMNITGHVKYVSRSFPFQCIRPQ